MLQKGLPVQINIIGIIIKSLYNKNKKGLMFY